VLNIRDGRHPVLEQNLSEERFVPNDTILSSVQGKRLQRKKWRQQDACPTFAQIALITGPNMAGKSTYIRQVALLTLLAHTGSFIPAAEARIDLVDRIFTRIGASDDLARGQSTFMVEMCETANILNNSSARSLIVLDEIGRGTSTFDGLSLAWSIVSICTIKLAQKRCLRRTITIDGTRARLPRLKNFNVACASGMTKLFFCAKSWRRTDKSYGIQVADWPACRNRCWNARKNPAQSRGIRTHAGRHRAAICASAAGSRKLKQLARRELDLFDNII